ENQRSLLSTRLDEIFHSTCYLSQSTIRNLVTCESSTLGRIIEAIIVDEASDIFIQGLLAANVGRTSAQFSAAKPRIDQESRELQELAAQLQAAEARPVPPSPPPSIAATHLT